MQKNKNRKSTHMLTIMLAALITVTTAATSIMTGCGEPESSDTNATVVINETQIVTSIVEYTEVVTDSDGSVVETYYVDENGNSVVHNDSSSGSSSQGNGNSQSGNAGGENSENNNNNGGTSSSVNKISSGSSTNSGSKNSGSSSSANTSNSSKSSSTNSNSGNSGSSKTLSVSGNKYNVGDTVVCELNITSPTALENYEGTLNYDTKYLKIKTAHLVDPGRAGGVCNYKSEIGKIKFNGVSIMTGFDYTDGGTLLYAEFEVIAGGSTKPSVAWEAVTQLKNKGGTQYIQNGKPANGFKASLAYS